MNDETDTSTPVMDEKQVLDALHEKISPWHLVAALLLMLVSSFFTLQVAQVESQPQVRSAATGEFESITQEYKNLSSTKQARIDGLRQENQTLKEENQQLRAQKKTLENDHAAERYEWFDERRQLEKEMADLRSEVRQLRSELSDLRSQTERSNNSGAP